MLFWVSLVPLAVSRHPGEPLYQAECGFVMVVWCFLLQWADSVVHTTDGCCSFHPQWAVLSCSSGLLLKCAPALSCSSEPLLWCAPVMDAARSFPDGPPLCSSVGLQMALLIGAKLAYIMPLFPASMGCFSVSVSESADGPCDWGKAGVHHGPAGV